MPSSKRRDFDDTWKKEELEKSLKGTKDDRQKRKDKDRDREKSRKREDDDRQHRRKEDDDRRERRHKENGESERKDKHKSSRHRDEDGDREKRHRKEEGDREKRHRRHREENDEEREKRHRRHKEENADKKPRRREETEEERRRRKEKERERERGHKSEENGSRRHRDDDRHKDDRRSKRGEDDEEERRRKHEQRKKERERQKEKEREEENERQRQRQKDREREAEKERERKKRERDKREKAEEKPEESGGGDDDDYNYEEDFEDYDDDFEDDDDEGDDNDDRASNKDEESGEENHSKGYYKSLDWNPDNATPNEVDDVMKAMNEENERLMRDAHRMKKQPSPYDSYDEDEEEEKPSYRSRPKTAQRTFINFVSAKQREMTGKAASKTMRRFKELRELIELDVAKFDLFDMPPVSEYELYMRSFGSTGTRQAYVQTNEDNIDRDIQTEEIETREMWVQNTPESIEDVGGPDFEKKEDEFAQISNQESTRRAKLWDRAVNATLILLEEDAAERIHGTSEDRKQSNICLSEAFQEVEIQSFNLLKDRTVICSHFSTVQTHMLLTVHNSRHNADMSKDQQSNKGIICVWNVNSPQYPQKVLVCESQPRCCCFSPSKATLAFAGMHDGSVLIWDLREPSSMHRVHRDGDTELVLRYPTYSTAGVLQYDNHQSAVIAIQPILTPTHSGGGSELSSSSEEGLSFQLATLEQYSVINLWVVAEMGHTDPAGSESDLGLSPGGRVKLIKSSTIQLESPLRDVRLRTTMQAFDMKLLPSHNSHFYVATDTGCVIHGVRYGGKAPPKAHLAEPESPVRVTSIDFSPFPEPVFLAGCEDGTLRLHHIDCEYPLITWPDATGGACIQAVRWCQSRPSVFFVLDTESRIHIWDLLMSDAVPMKFEKIAEERVTSLDLSNDHSATGVGLPGRKPQMVISLESGSTEIHTLSREFSALMSEELDQFKRLIQTIT